MLHLDLPAAPRDFKSMLPLHLAGHTAAGIETDETIAQFEIGSDKNFVYLLIDWKTLACAIVDPQNDLKPLQDAIAKYALKLEAILLTHTHRDHIAGLPGLAKLHPGIPVYVGADDLQRIDPETLARVKIHSPRDHEKIRIGELRIEAVHTPGHSPGECCYFIAHPGPYLFTGDTLFIRDCGRTDFPGGSNAQMFASLQKIKRFPSATIILCGHHYQRECASRLATEMRESAPLQCKTVQELEALP